MSRYGTPGIDLSRLKLEETSPKPKHASTAKARTNSRGQKVTASHRPSPSSGSGSSRGTSGTGSRWASTSHATMQTRSMAQQQNRGHSGAGGNNDGAANEESDGDEEGDEEEGSDHAELSEAQQRENMLRIKEMLAICTDTHISPVEFPSSEIVLPAQERTSTTRLIFQLSTNLAGFASNQNSVERILAGTSRQQLISQGVQNFKNRIQRIFSLYDRNIRDGTASDNAIRTSDAISRWQMAMESSIIGYEHRSMLTDAHKDSLWSTMLWALEALAQYDIDYSNSGPAYLGIYLGNIYRRWRHLHAQKHFEILRRLSTDARRRASQQALIRIDVRLQNKGERRDSDGQGGVFPVILDLFRWATGFAGVHSEA